MELCSLYFQSEHPIIEVGQVRALIHSNNNAEDNIEASVEREEVQDNMICNTEHDETHKLAKHTMVARHMVRPEK